MYKKQIPKSSSFDFHRKAPLSLAIMHRITFKTNFE